VQRHYSHRLIELTLAPLPSDESERLVENLLELADLPPGIRARILDQSEGNPFFVEEIIRSLIEQGALRREGERWVATGDMSRLAMPATLRGLIAARVDRLPAPAKATLQRAAVIGRFVGYSALRALHAGGSELDQSLAHLLRAELLCEWAHAPERQYIFKHALTQEAAYASILHEQRRTLHREAATFLERETTTAPDRAPLLAHHWLRTEDWEKALTYSVELSLGNVPAALAAARRAVDIARESHYLMEQGAALRVLGQACEAAGDMADADEAFRQSVEVLEATQSRPELAQTLLVYGRFRSRGGNGDGRVLIERALALLEEMDATGWIAEARAAL